MIKWYHDLYMDDYVKKRKGKIQNRIEKGKLSIQIYCIALSSNDRNLLDIMDVNELLFDHYKRNVICILGLASNKEAALELTRLIIDEIYQETGDIKLRDYFRF